MTKSSPMSTSTASPFFTGGTSSPPCHCRVIETLKSRAIRSMPALIRTDVHPPQSRPLTRKKPYYSSYRNPQRLNRDKSRMGNGITSEDVRFPPGVVIPGCSQYQCRQNIIRRSQCSTFNLCQSCRNIAIEIRPHNGNLLEKHIIPDTQLLWSIAALSAVRIAFRSS